MEEKIRQILHREILDIRYEVLRWMALEEIRQLKADLKTYLIKAGFDPAQARVPAGNPDGGQWTESGFGGWRPSPVTTTERLRRVDPPIEPSYIVENTLGILGSGTYYFVRRSAQSKLWRFGRHKSDIKWKNRMQSRGWTEKEISDTLAKGKKYPAPNKVNPGNKAIRYEKDGKYVVRDEKTKEILQISDKRFRPNEVD